MSRTSIISPQNSITTEDPAQVEANVRVEFIMNNIALIGIVFVSVLSVTGLVKREPIVNIFSER